MSAAMKSMNLEKISTLMDNFEKQFEDLDVQTSVMEGAMSQTTATNIPQDSVDVLMRQAADEAGLELNMELPGPAQQTVGQSTQVLQAGGGDTLSAITCRLLLSRMSCHRDLPGSGRCRPADGEIIPHLSGNCLWSLCDNL